MRILICLFLISVVPSAFACFRDLRLCEDGSTRMRSPEHRCEFWPPCPEDVGSTSSNQELQLQQPEPMFWPSLNEGVEQ